MSPASRRGAQSRRWPVRRPRGGARLGARAGTTLVEVIVAFSVLGTALVAMASFASTFVRAVSDSNVRGRAAEIAADRLETVKGGTDYETLDAVFAEPTPVAVADAPGFKRQTLFRRVGGRDADPYDYRVVTVVVTAPVLRQPLRRTTVIGDF